MVSQAQAYNLCPTIDRVYWMVRYNHRYAISEKRHKIKSKRTKNIVMSNTIGEGGKTSLASPFGPLAACSLWSIL